MCRSLVESRYQTNNHKIVLDTFRVARRRQRPPRHQRRRTPAPTSKRYAGPTPAPRALLVKAAEQMALSARAYHRVMKVARTIADLDNADSIARVHAAGALNYRFRPPGATTQKSGVGGLVA
jgi:predicted ATPase with chaperone activity